MSAEGSGPKPILYEEAGAVTRAITDERLRAFVDYGLTTVLVRRGMDPQIGLEADFDLRFFAEALKAMGANRSTLLKILTGDPAEMAWWPDKEK